MPTMPARCPGSTASRSPFRCFASSSAVRPNAISDSHQVEGSASLPAGRSTASDASAMSLPPDVWRDSGSRPSLPAAEIVTGATPAAVIGVPP